MVKQAISLNENEAEAYLKTVTKVDMTDLSTQAVQH